MIREGQGRTRSGDTKVFFNPTSRQTTFICLFFWDRRNQALNNTDVGVELFGQNKFRGRLVIMSSKLPQTLKELFFYLFESQSTSNTEQWTI